MIIGNMQNYSGSAYKRTTAAKSFCSFSQDQIAFLRGVIDDMATPMNAHDSIECDCGEDLAPLFMPFSGDIHYICEAFAKYASCRSLLPSYRFELIMFVYLCRDEQFASYLDPTL
jgi:hypothetical protein